MLIATVFILCCHNQKVMLSIRIACGYLMLDPHNSSMQICVEFYPLLLNLRVRSALDNQTELYRSLDLRTLTFV